MATPENIDAYIGKFPAEVQKVLREVRTAIKTAAPQAEEVISYSLPAFKWKGILVWFGAHTRHIGFYPRASAILAFKKELAPYHTAKGSVQFPFDEELPVALIKKMVVFRMRENEEKAFIKIKGNVLRPPVRAEKSKRP